MIEKLGEYLCMETEDRIEDCKNKINELVDAVNTIQKEREAERFEIQEWIGILEAVRKSVNKLETMAKNTNTVLKSLVEERKSGIKVYEEAQDMYDNAILDALKDKQVDIVVEPADNSEKSNCQENVQDKFAEQRKWIGCLCWFWDDDYDLKTVGVFEEITTIEGKVYYTKKDIRTAWEHCEPVKPDDDIIYRGE